LKRLLAERSVLSAFGATISSLYLLVGWLRELHPAWLFGSAAAAAVAAALLVHATRGAAPGAVQAATPRGRAVRRVPLALPAALVLLLLAVATAAVFSARFHRMERDWLSVVQERQARVGGALSARMSDAVGRGTAAARAAAELAAAERRDLFRQFEVVRESGGVDAVALYTDAGDLVAWAGEHRGPMPDSIWIRDGVAYFEERPLFSYLYFPQRVPGRTEYAVAAVLVETGIIGGTGEAAIADIVAARTRTRASFRRGGGPHAVWALTEGADTVVHARLDPVTQAEWRREQERTARRTLLVAMLGAYVALAAAWLLWARPAYGAPAGVLPLLLLVPLLAAAPLRDALGADRLFSPLLFTLPLPGDITLGRLLAVLLPFAALAAGARRRGRSARALPLVIALGAIGLAAAYPLALRLLLDGATPALLQHSAALWLGFQLAVVLALAIITLLALPRALGTEARRVAWLKPAVRRAALAGALLASGLLAVAGATSAVPHEAPRLGVASLWLVPFVLGALALAPVAGRGGTLARWLLAGWLAGTAALPQLWSAHMGARLAAAESELETLGSQADPYLEYLLVSFGREALARFAAGEEGVQLVYRTWVASGMAYEPYNSRVVLWSPAGLPDVQLGAAPVLLEAEANRLTAMVEDARDHAAPLIAEFTDLPNVSRLLTVPLADGSLITVVVPPRRSLDRPSAVAPFLGAMHHSALQLDLVEATAPARAAVPISWTETPTGWRSETLLHYPDGWYHAHLVVPVTGMGVRLVRGALLLTFNLLIFAVIWAAGVVVRGGAAVPLQQLGGWLGSFRARVTLALFGFFIVPTAIFGWAAYNALAGEVARAAERVAQHSVNQAVVEFEDAAGDLRRLATHAGTDVLRYHGGELIDVSSREALDLGVYSAWMPPHVYQRLEAGQEQQAVETHTLGAHSYVTAYRPLRPTGILGVPMPLTAGDTALRLRELAHLVLFAAVMGALLSLGLSLVVGRALAGPIGRLRRAAAAVGAGSLRTHLPERAGDEFGQLFAAFNRMTRRLRRARARELRTARVLAWGEMARQVAHEIKNPLTPIKLSVQHLRRAHADGHPNFDEILEANVEQILAEIDRLSEIARAFSRYGAPGFATGPLTAVDVPAVVREALTLYRSGDRHVEYADEIEHGLPPVQARPDELKEVLLNLVENSRAAMDGGGRVTVRAAALDAGWVELEVADDGPGIPADELPRIFEPHFSTRSAGTGLGLAIVRRLVESWGGTVTAESEPGRGTAIRVRLAATGR
jgi:signal transduction histidine kinase